MVTLRRPRRGSRRPRRQVFLFVSGQTALDPQSGRPLHGGDVAAQARHAYERVLEVVRLAGGGPEHLVQTIEYVTPDALARYRDTQAVRRGLARRTANRASTGLICPPPPPFRPGDRGVGPRRPARHRCEPRHRGAAAMTGPLLTDAVRVWIGAEASYTAPDPLGRASIRYFCQGRPATTTPSTRTIPLQEMPGTARRSHRRPSS